MNFSNAVFLFIILSQMLVGNGCISSPNLYNEKTEWRKLENEPPTASEIKKIRSALNDSLNKISSDLSSTSRYKRREAAYLLEMLGPSGEPVINALFDAYQAEYDYTTKAFFLRAMAEIDSKLPKQTVYLKIEFQYLLDSLKLDGTVNEMANEITRINFWER